MNSRKHPRTMQEAFGPYTNYQITPPPRPFDWQDKVVISGCVLAAVAYIVILCLA